MKRPKRLIADDPRCKDFVQMLEDYGLRINKAVFSRFLSELPLIESTPSAINDRREYYRTVYLKTEHWRNLKSKKMNDATSCQFCQAASGLDVHHRHYRDLYDVTVSDLAVLCRKCHDELHASVDPSLRGEEKENAIDDVFIQKAFDLPPPKLKKQTPHLPGQASSRRKFDRLLQRMISIASKIRKQHGVDDLSPKIRRLFRKPNNTLFEQTRKPARPVLPIDNFQNWLY